MNLGIRFALVLAALLLAGPSLATGSTTTAGPLISGYGDRDVSCDIFGLGSGTVEAELYRDSAVHATLPPSQIAPGLVVSLTSGYPGGDKAWTCKVWGDTEVAVTLSTIGTDQGSSEAVVGQKPAAGAASVRCEHGEGVIGLADGAPECACLDTGESAVGYYVDADEDGWSGETAPSLTTCTPPESGYTPDPNTGIDCGDASENAYPGSTYSSGTDRGDGSFDYNCDGVEEIVSAGVPSQHALANLPRCSGRTQAQCVGAGGLDPFDGEICGETYGFNTQCRWIRPIFGTASCRNYGNSISRTVTCR